MIIYNSKNNDPYYNLALEEYFFYNLGVLYNEMILITRNTPSILLSYNQNALSEINLIYSKQSNIKIARRVTGGDAIYQDLGTFNFSYMLIDEKTDAHNLFTVEEAFISFFKDTFNLDVNFSVTRRVMLNGKRCGGYAKIKKDNKILVHGTLSFNQQKDFLLQAKKIRSVEFLKRRKKYTTISENLLEEMSIEVFEKKFIGYVNLLFPEAKKYTLSEDANVEIQKIIDEKYSTWDWIFGETIDVNFENNVFSIAGNIQILLDIKDNKINKCKIYGDFFSNADIRDLENYLIGCEYSKEKLKEIINPINLEDYIFHIEKDKFVDYFFKEDDENKFFNNINNNTKSLS